MSRNEDEAIKAAVRDYFPFPGASRDFMEAAHLAKSYTRQDGLFPESGNDGDEYTLEQGVKAACHGREDTAAILILQKRLLERLDTIRIGVTLCVILLAYIAYKMH
jgi:hypothetical protein